MGRDEEVAHAPRRHFHQRQTTAARAEPGFRNTEIFDPIAYKWHPVVFQVGDENQPWFSRYRGSTVALEFDDQRLGGDVKPGVSLTFPGHVSALTRDVSVGNGAVEHALDQFSVPLDQRFTHGDDA